MGHRHGNPTGEPTLGQPSPAFSVVRPESASTFKLGLLGPLLTILDVTASGPSIELRPETPKPSIDERADMAVNGGPSPTVVSLGFLLWRDRP